jgi:stearoyl-CoA desaturase (delta-9 desaturase)
MPACRNDRTVNWMTVTFLVAIHVIAFAVIGSSAVEPPAWKSVMLGVVWVWLSGLSITGGYHRLFAHRSYDCAPAVALFYLLFGAAAIQNSALKWASDHRRHHAHTDSDEDPYDSRQGLWHSHIGWVLYDATTPDYANVRDLVANRLIAWQDRYYLSLALLMSGIVPALIASLWGDARGGVLWAGCVRLVVQYHGTFAVNSLGHRFGRQPYATSTSARDNTVVALVTMGEGYHNFHHQFPSDFRGGVRFRDYDPTKWLVWAFARVGLTWNLKRTPAEAIVRARRERVR